MPSCRRAPRGDAPRPRARHSRAPATTAPDTNTAPRAAWPTAITSVPQGAASRCPTLAIARKTSGKKGNAGARLRPRGFATRRPSASTPVSRTAATAHRLHTAESSSSNNHHGTSSLPSTLGTARIVASAPRPPGTAQSFGVPWRADSVPVVTGSPVWAHRRRADRERSCRRHRDPPRSTTKFGRRTSGVTKSDPAIRIERLLGRPFN